VSSQGLNLRSSFSRCLMRPVSIRAISS
jgi:hypothetical protein